MLILRVGDPHIKPSNIAEAEMLMQLVYDTAVKYNVDRIEILGDLMHTHSVIRLEVLEFWDRWLFKLSSSKELIVLVGNHDKSGDYNSSSNSLSVFSRIKNENLKIINSPTKIGIYGYMPYIHDKDTFIGMANDLAISCKILVCHQTIDGSRYESGFYAPDGVDPGRINFDTIISGHIHKKQTINISGKTIIYPGTPKWDTASDANESKGIWLFRHDVENGKILSEEFISTAGTCTPILGIEWREGNEAPAIPENSKVTIELIGSSSWISKQKSILKNKVSIKSKITDKKNTEQRKTGGSLENFIVNLYITNIDKELMLKKAKEYELV